MVVRWSVWFGFATFLGWGVHDVPWAELVVEVLRDCESSGAGEQATMQSKWSHERRPGAEVLERDGRER